jgi:integrase
MKRRQEYRLRKIAQLVARQKPPKLSTSGFNSVDIMKHYQVHLPGKRPTISKRDFDRLLKVARKTDPKYADLLEAAFATGLRVSDLIAVNWEDVNMLTETMVVSCRNNLEIPLPVCIKSLVGSRKRGPIFTDSNGKRWTVCSVRNQMHQLCQKTGRKIMIHDVRTLSKINLMKKSQRLKKKNPNNKKNRNA